MEWDAMSDAEVLLWFSESIKRNDVIPHNIEFGFRRMLGILARSAMCPTSVENLMSIYDGIQK